MGSKLLAHLLALAQLPNLLIIFATSRKKCDGGDLLAGMSDATGIDARIGTLDALKIVAASPGLGDSI